MTEKRNGTTKTTQKFLKALLPALLTFSCAASPDAYKEIDLAALLGGAIALTVCLFFVKMGGENMNFSPGFFGVVGAALFCLVFGYYLAHKK